MAKRHHARHVERMSNRSIARAADHRAPPHGTSRYALSRADPDIGGKRFGGVEATHIAQVGQHFCSRGTRDPRDAFDQFCILFQLRVPIDVIVDILLQLVELLLKEGDRVGQKLLDQFWRIGGIGLFLAVLLAPQVLCDGLTP